MSYHENVKIVAFVGLSGSGKSSVVDHMASKGYPKVYGGGVLYAAMAEAGIERTQENENNFRRESREREGADYIAVRIDKEINDLINAGQHRIIVDGLYSWDEYKTMKSEFPGELNVVAIVAPKHIRHHRLLTRPERPLTETEANERDWREIEDIQKGGPIAIADHFVINDKDMDNLTTQIDQIMESIDF
jgi:dephospho-CoA kinase